MECTLFPDHRLRIQKTAQGVKICQSSSSDARGVLPLLLDSEEVFCPGGGLLEHVYFGNLGNSGRLVRLLVHPSPNYPHAIRDDIHIVRSQRDVLLYSGLECFLQHPPPELIGKLWKCTLCVHCTPRHIVGL
jgi:hypothetical protein